MAADLGVPMLYLDDAGWLLLSGLVILSRRVQRAGHEAKRTL